MSTRGQSYSRSTVRNNTALPKNRNSQKAYKPVNNRPPRPSGYRKNSYNRNPDLYRSNKKNSEYRSSTYSYSTPSDLYRGAYGGTRSYSNSYATRQTLEYGKYSSNSYSSYNRSSVATDYYYDEDLPINAKTDMKNKREKRNGESAKELEDKKVNILKIVVSISVIFVLTLMMIFYSAQNNSQRISIDSKQAELATIKAENQHMSTTLAEKIDLVKIAKEAEKLGLQKPQAYQITEVQVPNESYTVQYEAKMDTKAKDIWSFLKSLL